MKNSFLIGVFLITSIWSHITFAQINFTRQDLFNDWTELKITRSEFVVYKPCDGQTQKIKLKKGCLIFIGQVDFPDTLDIKTIDRASDSTLNITGSLRVNSSVTWRMNIKWLDKSRLISLWKIKIAGSISDHTFKILFTPNNNKRRFKFVDNPCPDGKIDEKYFENIDTL